MTFNNYKNHIGKFIAENENNRFVQLNTNERYNIWKDTVTDKYYYSEPSGEEDCPRWFEAEYVASMRKDAWDAWDFESEADADEFTDLVAYCDASGEIVREDGVWIEWFELRHCERGFAYMTCDPRNIIDLLCQKTAVEDYYDLCFPYADVFSGCIEGTFECWKNLKQRECYQPLCEELEKCKDSVLIVPSLNSFCTDNITLSEELDRLKDMGIRVVTADGYFDSISPSSFDVIERKRNHNLPPHAVMLHRIKMAQYKALGKPQGFVLEDVE